MKIVKYGNKIVSFTDKNGEKKILGADIAGNVFLSSVSDGKEKVNLTGKYDGSSVDVTENGEFDIRELILNNQIPLKLNVNVESKISDVKLKPVTNIALNKSGILTWDAPETTDVNDNLENIIYIVDVNGNEIISETNKAYVFSYLVDGSNAIAITAKMVLIKENDGVKNVLEYEMPKELATVILTTTLPDNTEYSCATVIGENAYIFGNYPYTDRIIKFNCITETLAVLDNKLPVIVGEYSSASVGTNAYIFGNSKNIIKFDSISETSTLLNISLSRDERDVRQTCAVAIGANIYIIGGVWLTTQGNYLSEIIKFDSVSETITTLSNAILNNPVMETSATAIGNDIYIFGGYTSPGGETDIIQKFDSVSETISVMDIKLPRTYCEAQAGSVGTNIYIVGGKKGSAYIDGVYNYGGYTKNILKYDTIAGVITTLNTQLLGTTMYSSSVIYDTNMYIFGGYNKNTIEKIMNLS